MSDTAPSRAELKREKDALKADSRRWMQDAKVARLDVADAVDFMNKLAVSEHDPEAVVAWLGSLSDENFIQRSMNFAKFAGPFVQGGGRGAPKGHVQRTLYAFLAPSLGQVKLGIAENVRQRFASIGQLSPVELVVLATKPGSQQDEQALHRSLADYRVRGEWFRYEGAVADEIATWEPWA